MKHFFTLLVVLLVVSCSKKGNLNYTVKEENGVKHYSNKNIPSDTTATIKLKKLFTLSNDSLANNPDQFFRYISDLEVDKAGNIFLLDIPSNSIKKFNAKGEFIKSFGRIGNGPGEFTQAYDMFLANDTINLHDISTSKLVRFDSEGKFIDKILYEGSSFVFVCENMRSIGERKMLGYKTTLAQNQNGMSGRNNLLLMTISCKEIKSLRTFSFADSKNYPFFELATKFAYNDSLIAVAENEENNYKINIYDHNGKLKEVIKKNYLNIDYNSDELEYMGNNLPFGVNKPQKAKKKSINALYYDKYGRLIVCSSVKRTKDNINKFYADIFKDGVFLNSVLVDELYMRDYVVHINNYFTFFIKDRIYAVDSNAGTVTVYEYN